MTHNNTSSNSWRSSNNYNIINSNNQRWPSSNNTPSRFSNTTSSSSLSPSMPRARMPLPKSGRTV